jgi:SPP1 family predicted phage head-tail adaptor
MPVRGAEYWQAQKIRAELQYKIYVRYKDWIVPTMRIKYGNKIFMITSLINVDTDNHFLEIYATEYVDTHEES